MFEIVNNHPFANLTQKLEQSTQWTGSSKMPEISRIQSNIKIQDEFGAEGVNSKQSNADFFTKNQ